MLEYLIITDVRVSKMYTFLYHGNYHIGNDEAAVQLFVLGA